MGTPEIFKYSCRIEGKTAFVIAYNLEYAGQLLKEVTDKKVRYNGRRPIDAFPAAQENFDRKGPSVWINNIDPF